MTNEAMNLRVLIAETPDADLLREMIGFAAARLMDMEAASLTGAAYTEKNPDRRVQRNCYCDRVCEVSAGSVERRTPKLRKGSYFPFFLAPGCPAEKALTAIVQGPNVRGISTPVVKDPFKAMDKSGKPIQGRLHCVIGPDGSPLSIDNLPAPKTIRWVASRKAQVVAAVRGGLLSLEQACERYNLTVDEFMLWEKSVDRNGLAGLRVTRIQQYRSAEAIP